MKAREREWRLHDVRQEAVAVSAAAGSQTLGVAIGTVNEVEKQLLRKSKVITAMTERVEVCRDVQTEHLLCSQSLNVGRVNHILRVH
eukprot:4118930-Prorocentrum_lima.AAC.1